MRRRVCVPCSKGMIEKRVNNRAPLRWMGTRSHPIPAVAKSFVDLLLEGDPAVRLGGKETGGKYRFIHHAFMWAVVGFWGWRQPRRRDDNPTKKTKMKTSCFIILRSTVVRDCFFFRSSSDSSLDSSFSHLPSNPYSRREEEIFNTESSAVSFYTAVSVVAESSLFCFVLLICQHMYSS